MAEVVYAVGEVLFLLLCDCVCGCVFSGEVVARSGVGVGVGVGIVEGVEGVEGAEGAVVGEVECVLGFWVIWVWELGRREWLRETEKDEGKGGKMGVGEGEEGL